jgi:hypothetical protein
MKKMPNPEVTPKSTKDQIFAAYNEVLEKLNEKQAEVPQEIQKKQEEKTIVAKAAAHSPDAIVSGLGGIKLTTIKQLDALSEALLGEFQKLSDIRQAISSEQRHLEDLYQIKETAHTLAALFQAHVDQKEKLQQERDQEKRDFDHLMASQRLHWKEENERLERDFQDKKEKREKDHKREEEEYAYAREMQRRKDMDDYATQKAELEKELMKMREDIQKREEAVSEKEKILSDLQSRVDEFPEKLQKAVAEAEEKLRAQILQHHDFESQIKQKELDGLVKLHNLQLTSLQGKIKEQEGLIKELSQKADQAAENVHLIACRALDASSPRFVATSVSADDKVVNFQK